MNKLILYNDEEGSEFVVLCTDQEYYDGIKGEAKVAEEIDIEQDLTAWPTNRPLLQDF